MKLKHLLNRSVLIPLFAVSLLTTGATAADITRAQAATALNVALKKAESQGTLMNIAVVDSGANLKAFVRMDEAFLGSIDIAIKKAKTARYFNMPTGELGQLSQPGAAIYQIELSNGGLVTFPGGMPLKNKEGKVIGAIGVSGGTIDDDHAVAMAAVDALSN